MVGKVRVSNKRLTKANEPRKIVNDIKKQDWYASALEKFSVSASKKRDLVSDRYWEEKRQAITKL